MLSQERYKIRLTDRNRRLPPKTPKGPIHVWNPWDNLGWFEAIVAWVALKLFKYKTARLKEEEAKRFRNLI